MKGHTVECMSCEVDIIHSKSSNQKFNTKSTTESEVVAFSEYVPYKTHMITLFWGQGYTLHKKVLYQNNKSAIIMGNNGINLCTVNSRHISIRYFFVEDCLDKEVFSIEYFKTLVMLTNFFTKPLKGPLFRRLGEVIMG